MVDPDERPGAFGPGRRTARRDPTSHQKRPSKIGDNRSERRVGFRRTGLRIAKDPRHPPTAFRLARGTLVETRPGRLTEESPRDEGVEFLCRSPFETIAAPTGDFSFGVSTRSGTTWPAWTRGNGLPRLRAAGDGSRLSPSPRFGRSVDSFWSLKQTGTPRASRSRGPRLPPVRSGQRSSRQRTGGSTASLSFPLGVDEDWARVFFENANEDCAPLGVINSA